MEYLDIGGRKSLIKLIIHGLLCLAHKPSQNSGDMFDVLSHLAYPLPQESQYSWTLRPVPQIQKGTRGHLSRSRCFLSPPQPTVLLCVKIKLTFNVSQQLSIQAQTHVPSDWNSLYWPTNLLHGVTVIGINARTNWAYWLSIICHTKHGH